jgi:hypothetical protein
LLGGARPLAVPPWELQNLSPLSPPDARWQLFG